MPGDMLGVPSDPPDQHRGQRVQEVQADEVQAGLGFHDTAIVHRRPRRSSKTGRSIHEKSGAKPVHQITFATSRTCPSSSTGRPSRTPPSVGTRSTPAAVRSFGLTRASGDAVRSEHPVAPSGRSACRTVRDVWPTNRHQRDDEPSGPAPDADGLVPGVPARQPRRMTARTTSRAISAPELPAPTTSTPPSELRRIPVVARVQLHDRRVELAARTPAPGAADRRHRDDDVVGLEPAVAGASRRTGRPSCASPSTRTPVAHRQLEVGRVGLEVVGHLVLGRER